MALDYYKAVVTDIIDESPTVKRFFLEFPELDVFEYQAGQYVKVDMPIDDKKTYRQYSIASEPVGENKIELLIVLNPVGKGTAYLFNEVKIGTELKVSKALGRFVLPKDLDKEICFVCTGVGLAPFRSMYLDVLNKAKDNQGIHLVFGTRTEDDLLYEEELIELDKKFENFHYYPTLSRSGDTWKGNKGYVHDIYKDIFKDQRNAKFYLCGWDIMVSEAKKNLKEMGYERKDILFEKYD